LPSLFSFDASQFHARGQSLSLCEKAALLLNTRAQSGCVQLLLSKIEFPCSKAAKTFVATLESPPPYRTPYLLAEQSVWGGGDNLKVSFFN
jgi:hypothetical protein